MIYFKQEKVPYKNTIQQFTDSISDECKSGDLRGIGNKSRRRFHLPSSLATVNENSLLVNGDTSLSNSLCVSFTDLEVE